MFRKCLNYLFQGFCGALLFITFFGAYGVRLDDGTLHNVVTLNQDNWEVAYRENVYRSDRS